MKKSNILTESIAQFSIPYLILRKWSHVCSPTEKRNGSKPTWSASGISRISQLVMLPMETVIQKS